MENVIKFIKNFSDFKNKIKKKLKKFQNLIKNYKNPYKIY